MTWLLTNEKVRAALALLITATLGALAEHLLSIINAVGTAPPV
jgi:hypothetical protein